MKVDRRKKSKQLTQNYEVKLDSDINKLYIQLQESIDISQTIVLDSVKLIQNQNMDIINNPILNGQYFVDYETSRIYFSNNDISLGDTIVVTYFGLGSKIFAEEINKILLLSQNTIFDEVTNVTSNITNTTANISWIYPNQVNIVKSEVYMSTLEIKSFSRDDCRQSNQITKIYESNVINANTNDNTNYDGVNVNINYYFKIFLSYSSDGIVFWTNGITGNLKKLPNFNSWGVKWDITSDVITRLGTDCSTIPTGKLGENYFLTQSLFKQIKRCNVSDDGVITSWLGDDDYKIDGSNGQVMSYLPKLYFKKVPNYIDSITSHNCKEFWISDSALSISDGFKCHRSFYKDINGDNIKEEVNYRLFSVYEGSIDTNNKLCSISDVLPVVNKSIDELKISAHNRGIGWEIQDNNLTDLIKLIHIVMYASFDSQEMIGQGMTYPYTDSSPTQKTGSTNFLGNKIGYNTSNFAVNFLSIENLWGNTNKFIDKLILHLGIISTEEGSINETYTADSWNNVTIKDVLDTDLSCFIPKLMNGNDTDHKWLCSAGAMIDKTSTLFVYGTTSCIPWNNAPSMDGLYSINLNNVTSNTYKYFNLGARLIY